MVDIGDPRREQRQRRQQQQPEERQARTVSRFKTLFARTVNLGPLENATQIVRRTADAHKADISTLFVVQQDRLTLAGAYARDARQPLVLPRQPSYPLPWDEASTPPEGIGLTPLVAMTGRPLFIESFEDLRTQPDSTGSWDQSLYPDGVDHPTTGFGCSYAVPLRASATGSPRDTVFGVFTIARRRNRVPFTSLEREAFDIVASHLSDVLLLLLEPKEGHAGGQDRGRHATRLDASPDNLFYPILEIQVSPLAPSSGTKGSSAAGVPHAYRDLIHEVGAGFKCLRVAQHHKVTALKNLGVWLEANMETRPHIEWMVEQGKWSLLLDSFYRWIPFGTGGRRGPVGLGTNRFNKYTLAGSVQGHIDFLREADPREHLSVVVVYDVREFHDLRGTYRRDDPLIGVSSREFARVAAEVYTGNGVQVYMPRDGVPHVSTPELSYAIRTVEASGGLNVSASHNFPDDNGGKFYNRHGGQAVPPNDQEMADRVATAAFVRRLPFDRALDLNRVSYLDPQIHEAYLSESLRQSLRPEARRASIVLTPLHGSGDSTAGEVMRRAGFDVSLVLEQSTPDGRFPAVPFRAPNPEVPESMALGIEHACTLGADLVMSCDPDADRIGVCARTAENDYQFLNGNEIAVLVTHYKLDQLRRQRRLPATPLIIKTEVTTELLRPIVEEFGGTLLGNLLVGFKYHAEILEQLEHPLPPESARRQMLDGLDREANLQDFVIAVEESHGVLVTSAIRDKDAAGAAMLLAELAAVQRARSRTVVDYLEEIYLRYGYYSNQLCSMIMKGAEGLEAIEKIQHVMRRSPPERIADWRVTTTTDHHDTTGRFGRILSDTDRASRDVLVYNLENGARVILRPSGTEPKNKVYVEVPSSDVLGAGADHEAFLRQKAETDAVAQQIADAFTLQMLDILGILLPRYALRISGLVPLDQRTDFAFQFIPALEERATAMMANPALVDETSAWIDERLASYGPDARGLVGKAFQQYLDDERRMLTTLSPADAAAERRRLDVMEQAFASR